MMKIHPFAPILLIGVLLTACVYAEQPAGPDSTRTIYLFSSFRGNGEDGLHLAVSRDGLRWRALKNDETFLRPEIGGKLMRDPSVCQGPDGMFHMVWTTGWWDKGIGLAHSANLIDWSEQKFLPVMEHEPDAKNCWAPEIFYDKATQTYYIIWATTVPGRFPETENPQDDNNHRIYCTTTKDFETFTDAKVFYDPGFNVIDSFLAYDDASNRYVMFLKNETKVPKAEKNIRVAFADKAAGPYGPASEPITGGYWAEGPAALKIDGTWYVYFDKYTEHQYGAVKSDDLEHWTDISDRLRFPSGTRHGTPFKASLDVLKNLMEQTP
jgi:beta-xylosidase